ncbi:YrhC family protein [Halobacillus sp. Nhm2S1]|uniref:YrhC family protein n=1 Tax=Halobacillus sp. Nhm2S1 TaxID=2866716 RepID=UPI0021083156|nr:YrhC family protein [Halobacillus sp. Nhm2S1]
MLDTSQWLKEKISDYKRFVITLLIMSTYLYIGTLISLYEYGTKAYLFLYPVMGIALVTAFVMTWKIRKWKKKLVED